MDDPTNSLTIFDNQKSILYLRKFIITTMSYIEIFIEIMMDHFEERKKEGRRLKIFLKFDK